MRDTPTKEELLGAVAAFLDETVRPAIDDRGLAFRLRIASNLLKTVAIECTAEDGVEREELASLRWVLERPGDPPADRKTLRKDLRALNRELADGLKSDDLPDERLEDVGAHLRAVAAADLALVNPRFDLSSDIE